MLQAGPNVARRVLNLSTPRKEYTTKCHPVLHVATVVALEGPEELDGGIQEPRDGTQTAQVGREHEHCQEHAFEIWYDLLHAWMDLDLPFLLSPTFPVPLLLCDLFRVEGVIIDATLAPTVISLRHTDVDGTTSLLPC